MSYNCRGLKIGKNCFFNDRLEVEKLLTDNDIVCGVIMGRKKEGVAILWKTKFDSYITPLTYQTKTRIPIIDQAAYQEGRNTTEQVFSKKLLAKKAITSSEYKVYFLLLDMSKAFDTVNRNQLSETLEEILLPDKIHLLHILTNDVKLKVRVGADYGPEFTTSV